MNHLATAERLQSMAPALYYICLAADIEYEKTGTVSPLVIEQLRRVINEPSSTKTRVDVSAGTEASLPVSAGSGFIQQHWCMGKTPRNAR